MHGADSLPMAEHHARHLEEFASKESIEHFGCGAEVISPTHSIAFMIVEEKHKIIIRDTLRPKRAELAE